MGDDGYAAMRTDGPGVRKEAATTTSRRESETLSLDILYIEKGTTTA